MNRRRVEGGDRCMRVRHPISQMGQCIIESPALGEVWRVFGGATADWVRRVCVGDICYLQYMPRALQVRILSSLDLLDLARLSHTSRHFRQVPLILIPHPYPLPSQHMFSSFASLHITLLLANNIFDLFCWTKTLPITCTHIAACKVSFRDC